MRAEETFMANVYAKRPLLIVRGKGAYVYDDAGREYNDFTGSYGACVIGHAHPRVVEAISRQAQLLVSCHGSFYSDIRSKFLTKLVEVSPRGLDRAFLGNSGAEAVECAIKLARRFTGRQEIVATMGAFHGKSLGALSATWDKKYRDPFMPLVPGFSHVPFGNLEIGQEAVTEETAAFIVEPIQGEGGVRPAPEGYLAGLRETCHDRGALLIVDEVQTGFGRTGKMFACQHWGVTPDILCFGKGVAGGLPIGVTMASDEIMSSLRVGEHTSTYGGTPIVCAAACATIDVLEEEGLVARAADLGIYLMERLRAVKASHPLIRDVRGLGLMVGVEFRFDVRSIVARLMEERLVVLDAGLNVLRLLPPLVIERSHIERFGSVLDRVLELEEHEKLPRATVGENA